LRFDEAEFFNIPDLCAIVSPAFFNSSGCQKLKYLNT